MSTPLFYILAPFGLAFILFAVFLIVSIFLKDPARPFRMFAAPPLDKGEGSAPLDKLGAEECSVQSAEERPKKEQEPESRRQESGEEQEQTMDEIARPGDSGTR
jgi:hypothetical protein